MADFYCEACGFRFSVKPGKPVPKKCQYCSIEGGIKPVKKAQDWLDEVSSLETDED